ncbi:hypothetical protein MKZ17_10955 [Solibacillus sp. FSL R7-0682]|uniref:hypothetical protein n=1 Tax=Solibacillus sp. FSL R7-0682 TaxID=2921690 RepID=UPI0030F764A1
MNNLQRLQMETKGIELEQGEMIIYLQENGLEPYDKYDVNSIVNKRRIYMTALSVLESIANNTSLMSTLKIDDMTVSDFHEQLLARINQLEDKINKIPNSEEGFKSTFLLYN